VERALYAVADHLAAVADVGAEMPAVTRQHVQFTRFVAVGDQILAEVPQRTYLARAELGRPADHEPAGDLPRERDLHGASSDCGGELIEEITV
jgi:hypothetical protein